MNFQIYSSTIEDEETILKVPYVKKLLAIKGVGSILIAGFIAEVGDTRRFDSPNGNWWRTIPESGKGKKIA